jgi:hypothetical protein
MLQGRSVNLKERERPLAREPELMVGLRLEGSSFNRRVADLRDQRAGAPT